MVPMYTAVPVSANTCPTADVNDALKVRSLLKQPKSTARTKNRHKKSVGPGKDDDA